MTNTTEQGFVGTQAESDKANLEWHRDLLKRLLEFRMAYLDNVDHPAYLEFARLVTTSGQRFGQL